MSADVPRRVLDEIADDWALTIGDRLDSAHHYVADVTRADGTPAVLKLFLTGDPLDTEVHALRAFGGRGAVRLLRADLGRGALLLERAEPGDRLGDLVPARDVEATSIAAGIIRELVAAPPDPALPDLVTRADAFDEYVTRLGDGGPVPRGFVVRAGGLMRELCVSAPGRVALHGDLHHDNILRATRAPWLAIDPHGLTGDPGYETGALLYNPELDDRDPALAALALVRVEQLADELAMPLERVVAWGFVKAVLSEVWSAEDWTPDERSPVSRALDVARLLAPRLPA